MLETEDDPKNSKRKEKKSSDIDNEMKQSGPGAAAGCESCWLGASDGE